MSSPTITRCSHCGSRAGQRWRLVKTPVPELVGQEITLGPPIQKVSHTEKDGSPALLHSVEGSWSYLTEDDLTRMYEAAP